MGMEDTRKRCPSCCGAGYNKTIDDYCPVCGGNGLDPASYDLVETGLDGVVMLRPKTVVWPTACLMCNQSLFPRDIDAGVCPDCKEEIVPGYLPLKPFNGT